MSTKNSNPWPRARERVWTIEARTGTRAEYEAIRAKSETIQRVKVTGLRVCEANMYLEAIEELATEEARSYRHEVLDGARIDV